MPPSNVSVFTRYPAHNLGCAGTGWMQTATGRKFQPLNPHVDDLHIEDIASSLSKICRYNGHCLEFYSVAEHCVLASREVPERLRLTMLMSDGQEAYLTDLIRPIKQMLPGYAAAEERLAQIISVRFGTIYPLPDEVIRVDRAILTDERAQNMMPMNVSPADWGNTEPGLGVTLRLWAPSRAKAEFMNAFAAYGGVA